MGVKLTRNWQFPDISQSATNTLKMALIMAESPLLKPSARLKAGCQVTLVGDAGLSGPGFLDTARELGWDVVLRVNTSATQAHRVRLLDAAGEPGPAARLWDVVAAAPPGWHAAAEIFKGAGWRQGFLTVCRRPGCAEPWVLFSSRSGGAARVREYARRARVEATFADSKTRGWGLEHSRLRERTHLDRLLLAWHLSLWWLHALGREVIKSGRRAHFDRRDRRDRSVVRLGWLDLLQALLLARVPRLLFRSVAGGWVARGTP